MGISVSSEIDKQTGEYKLYPASTKNAIQTYRPGVWKLNEPITGYKKINCQCDSKIDLPSRLMYVAKVTIPVGAKVVRSEHYDHDDESDGISDKIRTDNFTVDEIKTMSLSAGNPIYHPELKPVRCVSLQNKNFTYEAGKSYKPDKLDENTNLECSHGLYFFLSENKAFWYNI